MTTADYMTTIMKITNNTTDTETCNELQGGAIRLWEVLLRLTEQCMNEPRSHAICEVVMLYNDIGLVDRA